MKTICGAFGVVLAVLACGGPDLAGPSLGDIAISVATTGVGLDADGYAVAIDSEAGRSLGLNGVVTFAGVQAGAHLVALRGLAWNCFLSHPSPVSVNVSPGATTPVAFQVTCAEIVLPPPSQALAGMRPS